MNQKSREEIKILIVEDNPGDYTLIRDYIEEQIESPQIVHAKNFSEAETIFKNKNSHLDVILLDLTLPDKDGESLIKETIEYCQIGRAHV